MSSRLNGKPSAAIGVQLSSTGNALATSNAVYAQRWRSCRNSSRTAWNTRIPYDTTPFVDASIEKVCIRWLEAMVLVFIVMFLFLQNFRYTIIPTLVVPVALLGHLRA